MSDPVRSFGVDADAGSGARSSSGPRPLTLRDELAAEIAREVSGEKLTLKVKARPGWAVRYRCDVEVGQLNRWRKSASDRSMPDGLDELKLGATILANQAECLVKDGEDLLDDQGDLVTFTHPMMQELTGLTRPVDIVKRWYANDGHLVMASQEVLRESGYGEEAERADPTQR